MTSWPSGPLGEWKCVMREFAGAVPGAGRGYQYRLRFVAP
jgi:hypothetical protein